MLKLIAARVMPEPALTVIRAIRARRHSQRLNAGWGIRTLSERMLDTLGSRVLTGPFAGLTIPSSAAAEHLSPYLLGVYEHELHDVWRKAAEAPPPLVVNVGAKFGYYAVGLTRLLGCPVVAFDADPWAREVTRETARVNRVKNVTVHGRCTRKALAALPPGTLVMIDCDGCEIDLLRPPLSDGLRQATIVVEVHDAVVCGSGHVLHDALAASHDIEEIPTADAPVTPAVDLSFLTPQEREQAVSEMRPPQSWLVCRPKATRV